MRYVLFRAKGAGDSPAALRVGALAGDGVNVANVSASLAAGGGALLTSMRHFLDMGAAANLAAAQAALAAPEFHVKLADVDLRAPIYDCEKVLCVGMNYVDHCTEQNVPIPKEPLIFSKFASCICAPGDDVVAPYETAELDYEVELVIVIGKEGRRIARGDAMSHVAGFTVAHDVSARDWQLKKNGGQWLLGKAMDGFAPLGPSIVTPDEVGDVHDLRLTTTVNGRVLQEGSTRELVHKTEDLLVWISKFMTLKPGDIILTGTPPGVGCFRKPDPIWLHPGDVVTVEIEKLGSVTNRIVADPAAPEAK